MSSTVRLLVFLFFIFIAASCSQEKGNVDARSSEVRVDALKYSLLPNGERVLTGKLINQSDRMIQGAQIQVSLFDQNNRRVGSMHFVVREVGPYQEKSFRQGVDATMDVHGARVRSVIVL